MGGWTKILARVGPTRDEDLESGRVVSLGCVAASRPEGDRKPKFVNLKHHSAWLTGDLDRKQIQVRDREVLVYKLR